MAERGRKTLLFGPMKPVGLEDPKTGKRPYAVVQLRQDDAAGTLYNILVQIVMSCVRVLPLLQKAYNPRNIFLFQMNLQVQLQLPFEKEKYFEGCMPFEVMAERGRKTLLFGPMKPVGLEIFFFFK
jgi:folate-dependent tRNA-U54 methylase TrmFO/GidA